MQSHLLVLMLPGWWLSRALQIWLHHTEGRTSLLLCTLHAGSLTLAEYMPSLAFWHVLAKHDALGQYPVPCSKFTLPVQRGPLLLFVFFCLPVAGDR